MDAAMVAEFFWEYVERLDPDPRQSERAFYLYDADDRGIAKVALDGRWQVRTHWFALRQVKWGAGRASGYHAALGAVETYLRDRYGGIGGSCVFTHEEKVAQAA
jgi:hypothetical protein